MYGIDLNRPIEFKICSLRFFDEGERHISRFCTHDVLLMVYEGVLRFTENGESVEVSPGEYYIQKHDAYQSASEASSSPKYLYVHFLAEWIDSQDALPRCGKFDYDSLSPIMNRLDRLSHEDRTYTEKTGLFFNILSALYRSHMRSDELAGQIARYLSKNYLNVSSLEDVCSEFHYSKNYIINIFKSEYGMTPFEYINDLKIKRAMYLLEVTSGSIEDIARESGFNHYSHFYRLFMRKNGMSPFAWRNNKKLNPFI